MEYGAPVFLAFSFLVCLLYLIKLGCKRRVLPPGPYPVPILGNLLHLTNRPHHSLTKLAKMHGPLMTLKLGSVTTILVSSVDVAAELFQVHDKSFSARNVPHAARALDHHAYSIGWLPTSSHWRNLRKITAAHLFTKHRLDATQVLRQNKVVELLGHVRECCETGQAMDIGRSAFTMSLNLLSNTFFSIDLAGYNSTSSQEFRDVVQRIMEGIGRPNLADFFPLLTFIDPFGVRRIQEGYLAKMFAIFDGIIRERLSSDDSNLPAKDDVLGALLSINQEDASALTLLDINHLLLDLFAAGTDTTSSTIEWAMAELLRDPTKLAKAQAEMDQAIGNKASVQESDITRLPYLQAVVKETLRLHPPAPFLIPRKSEKEVSLYGYVIPKDSQLLVNAWGMARDPTNWENPQVFHPERFIGSDTDLRGHHFELIPFGAGRRICPGLPLAHRMLHIMLATLIQFFNWKLEGGIRGGDIDMSDSFGISLHKATPLLAVPVPR